MSYESLIRSESSCPAIDCPESLRYEDESAVFEVLYSEIKKLGRDPQRMLYKGHNNITYFPLKSTFAMTKTEIDHALEGDGSELTPISYADSRVLDEGGVPVITVYDESCLVWDETNFVYVPLPNLTLASAEVMKFKLV